MGHYFTMKYIKKDFTIKIHRKLFYYKYTLETVSNGDIFNILLQNRLGIILQ